MATRFGRRQLGYLWGLLEPAVFVLVLFVLFYLMNRKIETKMSLALVLLSGVFPWIIFYRTDNFIRSCIHSNLAVLYHPVLKPLHIYISRFVLEAATTVTFSVVALAVYGIVWRDPQAIPQRP